MERTERVIPNTVAASVVAEQYQSGVCGSCYWHRKRLQFGRLNDICSVMPKQLAVITQPQGGQIVSLNPVIENLAEELCSMWKPLREDTQ